MADMPYDRAAAVQRILAALSARIQPDDKDLVEVAASEETFAVLLQAGLEGIEKGYELPEPMEKNLYHLSGEERRRLGVDQLPESLGEAIEITAESELVLRTLGEHMFNRYIEIKRQEWNDYRIQVTPWELQRYLPIL